jgi:hypothetical protein
MHLIAYADDSGTHDKTGVKPGARECIVAGYVAPAEDWKQFRLAWKAKLDQFNADYFHFYEVATASRVIRGTIKTPSNYEKNPFKKWSVEKIDRFLIELSAIAGGGNRHVTGSFVNTDRYHAAKRAGDLPEEADPYEHALEHYFASVLDTIHTFRPVWKRTPICFVFDQSDKPDWKKAISEVFGRYKAKYSQFREFCLEDKKHSLHTPLQAADMWSFRARQIAEQWVDNEFISSGEELTLNLVRNTFGPNRSGENQRLLGAFMRGELSYDYFKQSRDG